MNRMNNNNNRGTRRLKKQLGRRNIYTPPDEPNMFTLPTINNEEGIRQIARNYKTNNPSAFKKWYNQRRGERILLASTPGLAKRTYKTYNANNNNNNNNYNSPVRPQAPTYVAAPSAASMLQGIRFRTRKNRQRK